MTNEELWQAALGEIELSISKANFITWFKNTSILSNVDGRVVVGVPNGFAKEWLENKYNTYIIRALQNIQENTKEISCKIHNFQPETININNTTTIDAVKAPNYQLETHTIAKHSLNKANYQNFESNLNSRYTFDSFIVGENNELARAACYAVSQNLGKTYNPLFIYGGVGLGKTHLLQSLVMKYLKKAQIKRLSI